MCIPSVIKVKLLVFFQIRILRFTSSEDSCFGLVEALYLKKNYCFIYITYQGRRNNNTFENVTLKLQNKLMGLLKDMLLKTTFTSFLVKHNVFYALKILGFFQLNQGIVTFVFR